MRARKITTPVGLFFVVVLCSTVAAQNADVLLKETREAHQKGDYRRAAGRLNVLGKSESALSFPQRLQYWNLCADVALDSGLLNVADKAARTHLALLQKMAATAGEERAAAEQCALVRLARIERSYWAADNKRDLQDNAAAARWNNACALLTKALAIAAGMRSTDPVWEAETRLDLARALQVLGREAEARNASAAANTSATAALARLGESPEQFDSFLRSVAVVQHSFLPGDLEEARRHAELAAKFVAGRLRAVDVDPADRVRLLVAGASCRRQLQDAAGETQLLTDALNRGAENIVEPLIRAAIMVRLAELADANPNAAQPANASALYSQAARLYGQILANADAEAADTGNRPTLSAGQRAECLLQMQLIYVRLEDWTAAIAAAEKLLELRSRSLLASEDPNYYRSKSAVGSLYAKSARSTLTRSVDEQRDFSKAREDAAKARTHLQAASEFWRRYRPTSRKDLAATLNYYAEALRYNGEFREANRLLDEAQPQFDAAYEPSAMPLGEYYSNRGAVRAALGLFQPALTSYKTAIDVANRNEADDDLRARGQLLAFAYLNMAQLYKSQGQYADARKMCDEARAETARWPAPADTAPFLLTDAALAIAEADIEYRSVPPNAKGDAARQLAQRQLQAARDSFGSAIVATREVLNDRANPDPLNADSARHLQAVALYRLHLLFDGKGPELEEATRLWEQIADSPAAVGDSRSNLLRVRALSSLALVALREAADVRARARIAQEDIAKTELMKRGNEKLTEAAARSAEAERIAENMLAYPAVRFQALLTRAQVLDAEAQILRAAAGTLKANDNTAQADESQRKADASTDDAITILYKALELIELPRAMTTGAEEQRAAYFAQFSPGFDLLVDLLFERQRHREALEVSEQRRSRTFLDQLRIAGVDLYETVPEADRGLVENARRVRDEYYTGLASLMVQQADGTDFAGLATRLKDLQRELVDLEEKIRSSSTVYRQLLAKPLKARAAADAELADADWLAQQIDGQDVALVYHIGSEKSYLFECSQQHGIRGQLLTLSAGRADRLGLPSAKLSAEDGDKERPLRADDVIKLVKHLAADVSRPPSADERSRGEDLRIVSAVTIEPKDLALVTDILLPDSLRTRIAAGGSHHVLVVPDGALHQLAFESLPTDAGRKAYLLDEFPPICYAPSLQIYRELRERGSHSAEATTLVTVADPLYRQSAGSVRNASSADLSLLEQDFRYYLGPGVLSRLADTKVESDRVRNAFQRLRPQPDDVIALTDQNATETKLKEALNELSAADRHVGFLHVAAHGLVDQRYNNLFGALALTPPSRPTAMDDGFLTLYEVMMLPLRDCNLAMLSACETNCGPENALEAGSTMARAFFCAGAQRVVCSHWKVSDRATAELIADFMDHLTRDLAEGKAVDYAAALQQAKQKLRRNESTSGPYFWAPFVLIGTPSGGAPNDARERLATIRD